MSPHKRGDSSDPVRILVRLVNRMLRLSTIVGKVRLRVIIRAVARHCRQKTAADTTGEDDD